MDRRDRVQDHSIYAGSNVSMPSPINEEKDMKEINCSLQVGANCIQTF